MGTLKCSAGIQTLINGKQCLVFWHYYFNDATNTCTLNKHKKPFAGGKRYKTVIVEYCP